jgi:hypothetical protein
MTIFAEAGIFAFAEADKFVFGHQLVVGGVVYAVDYEDGDGAFGWF